MSRLKLTELFKKRIKYQGEKFEDRFTDRPISRERYKRLMLFIGSLILAFFLFSIMCIIYTIGAWFQ